jgi:Zn-dependent metalloprotease
VALRSLKEPGTAYNDPVLGRDPQPAHMRDFVHTADDDGGIHINSGIPNHAFFLAAAAIGGFAWEQAGLIWYTAARDKYTVNTDFAAAAAYTFQTAAELYGKDSPAQHAVQYGWEGVGIPVGATPPAPQPKPSGCSAAAPNFIRSLVRR